MDGYTYVDIFSTKGIEYLVVLSFLLIFLVFWKFLNSSGKPQAERGSGKPLANGSDQSFRVPDGIYYHKGHSWVAIESGDVVRIGLDDFAQKLIGTANSISMPSVGSRTEQGEEGCSFDLSSSIVDVLSPVSGEVVEVNQEVLKSPGLVNRDPYKDGWLMKVKVPRMRTEIRNLLPPTLAMAWTLEGVGTLHKRASGELINALGDEESRQLGIARSLFPDKWDEILTEFLGTR